MGRAEDAIRARDEAERRPAEERRASEEAADLLRRQAMLAEILALIPAALAAIEARHFEGGEMQSIERKTRLGGWKYRQIACWRVGLYSYPWKDGQVESTVWLTSDGKLASTKQFGTHDIDQAVLLRGGTAWDEFPYEDILMNMRSLAGE